MVVYYYGKTFTIVVNRHSSFYHPSKLYQELQYKFYHI